MLKLNSKGFSHWIVPMIAVLIIGGIGGYLYLRSSSASTTNLTQAQCKLLGRPWADPNLCKDGCRDGAGTYVNASGYNYCSNAVSTGINNTDCDGLGRKWTAGGHGCARRWQQTTSAGAIQCKGNDLSGGPYTYVVLSGRDKCVLSTSTSTGGSTPTSSSTDWVWPLPNSTHIGSGGYYLATGSKGYHPGIDIGATGGGSLGAAVKAAHSGTVTQSYNGGSCGWFMVVKASNTSYWMGYQHLDPNKSHLGAGTAVSAGQTIGYVGPAGGSSCGSAGFYHVHFSLELQNGLTFWNTSKSYVESRTNSPCSVLPGC